MNWLVSKFWEWRENAWFQALMLGFILISGILCGLALNMKWMESKCADFIKDNYFNEEMLSCLGYQPKMPFNQPIPNYSMPLFNFTGK